MRHTLSQRNRHYVPASVSRGGQEACACPHTRHAKVLMDLGLLYRGTRRDATIKERETIDSLAKLSLSSGNRRFEARSVIHDDDDPPPKNKK